ncbi:lycopene cyclase family protein [Fodinibius saliphilus]|uniref:lycopene cyclase family protein n=1 Tax=Fodinibius saliphilus TaxID=1920650 RepID=UPI001109A026|nr:lycopene cyclase family protein [Fodinibius saliphilus]
MSHQYDYIIAGAGAAGLSLAWELLHSPLRDKEVLIVDSDLEPKNEKTWCFWDSGAPPFEDIIYKKWNQIELSIFGEHVVQYLDHYPYYCLRSIDFKMKVFEALESVQNFTLKEMDIVDITPTSAGATLVTSDHSYTAEYIFQSCFLPHEHLQSTPNYPLVQHFLGWEIQCQKAIFDDSILTLMDFDETVDDYLAFMYLLPWSTKTGLIEYTVFSDQLLEKKEYEEKISLYLNNRFGLQPIHYNITRREFGKIPMQDRPFVPWYKPNILNIGTVGGRTKPSTGYTFKRIQQQVKDIVAGLSTDEHPKADPPSQKRYRAYDLWLLHIIHNHPEEARKVFNHLFKNNSIDEIFRFLGEETTIMQDLHIMSSVPYLPFLHAIWESRDRIWEI